ncbi:MAG TPA: lamin tail domain-containing protein [Myxococcota bacterium]|nr:lamin tail domain-containing protein [Myxococcota bacterium]
MRPAALLALALIACGPPEEPDETVEYRDGRGGTTSTGERGTVKITEILWSGSVLSSASGSYRWDPKDVFVELRNEGSRPLNLSGWRLLLNGPIRRTWRLPQTDHIVQVGEEVYVAASASGCFPEPDWILPDLEFPLDESFELTVRDADERLMETAGDDKQPVFAGGYDLATSRSMERIPLMFGSDGNRSQSWKFYQAGRCPGADGDLGLNCYQDKPNNDKMLPECRRHTHASPGRPNSPDYSGAFANGSFE